MRWLSVAWMVTASLAALGGCTSLAEKSASPALDGTAWVASAIAGHALLDVAVTARFENGWVTGSDGCNRYRVPYTQRGETIEVGGDGAASTMMGCLPEVMSQAQAFMAALAGARHYRLSEGRLELLAADGAVLLGLFGQQQSLADTSWQVTGINNGKEAVVSTFADTAVTMMFADDGQVSGSGGCNRYRATYQAGGGKLRFGPAAATRMACAPGVMEQEQVFFNALKTVATMQVEGDRLEMRTAEGALALNLVRSADR